jgi:hypothetical protein
MENCIVPASGWSKYILNVKKKPARYGYTLRVTSHKHPLETFTKLLSRTTVSKESLCSCGYGVELLNYHVQLEEIAEMCGKSDTATPAGLNSSHKENKPRPGLSLVVILSPSSDDDSGAGQDSGTY